MTYDLSNYIVNLDMDILQYDVEKLIEMALELGLETADINELKGRCTGRQCISK